MRWGLLARNLKIASESVRKRSHRLPAKPSSFAPPYFHCRRSWRTGQRATSSFAT